MIVTVKTKISDIINENENAIEVIASINSHFRKLRNPILRKLLASRVTVEQAARIGNVTSQLMLNRLKEVGFEVSDSEPVNPEEKMISQSTFQVDEDKLKILDVRPLISSGKDPFSLIMKEIKDLLEGHTLLIINTFEPVPLINILSGRGYFCKTEKQEENLFKTYFQLQKDFRPQETIEKEELNYSEMFERYKGNMLEIDVRDLEMPYPMITILNELTGLRKGSALLVNHKRIPQFLLPKLDEQGLKYAFLPIEEDYVQMLIIKD